MLVNKYRVPPGVGTEPLSSPNLHGKARRAWKEDNRRPSTEGRASLRGFQSTLLGIAAAEGRLNPALLDHCQSRFTQRLLARSQGASGPRLHFD